MYTCMCLVKSVYMYVSGEESKHVCVWGGEYTCMCLVKSVHMYVSGEECIHVCV